MSRRPKPTPPPAPQNQASVRIAAVEDLIFDETNARQRDEDANKALDDSLEQFGPARSIFLGKGGKVRAGNGTLERYAKLGGTQVIVIKPQPGQLVAVERDDLSEAQEVALAIADNQTGARATWAYEQLGINLRTLEADGFDITRLGFLAHELEPILAADWTPPPLGELPGQGGAAESDHAVVFSPGTWAPVKEAIDALRGAIDNIGLSEPEAIQAICSEYLDSRRAPA